jgi:hypothetical protein
LKRHTTSNFMHLYDPSPVIPSTDRAEGAV